MDLEARIRALYDDPGRGHTLEDRARVTMESNLILDEMNAVFLRAKQDHVARRDVTSGPGKLGADFDKLSANPDATKAKKKKLLNRVALAIRQAHRAALACNSGDLISEIWRTLVQSALAYLPILIPPCRVEVLDFAPTTTRPCHPVDNVVMLLEDLERIRKFPAVPAPMNIFPQENLIKYAGHIQAIAAKPYLEEFLARGPCGWHCLEDASVRGNKAEPNAGLVCSVKDHTDCLFVKVVDYEGINAFDFRYSKGN